MNTRESSVMQDAAAILAVIGIVSSNAPSLTRAGFVSRELLLSVSDGFTRQTWVQDGRVRRETRETLSMDDGEHVRITITNDMPGVRVVTLGDGRMLRLPAGQSRSIDVSARHGEEFSIDVVGQPALSRPVKAQHKASAGVKAA